VVDGWRKGEFTETKNNMFVRFKDKLLERGQSHVLANMTSSTPPATCL